MGDFMKLYDVNEIFIAELGCVKKQGGRATITGNEHVFVMTNNHDSNGDFIDVFSKKIYNFFSYMNCEDNEIAAFGQETLTGFIAKKCKNNKKLTNLSIIKKIINGELLNEIELKKLLFAINSGNIYKILSSDNASIINKTLPNNNKQKNYNSSIKLNYFITLPQKKYKLQPTIERDNEIKKILTSLAQKKKATLLVGERGVGKTSIVDEISHRISKKEIPNFLKNKKIIELNFNILNISIDSIEENIIDIIATAIKDDLIIFIDGLDNINNPNILNILKYEIEKNNLKVIATINSENDNKLYADDIFNRIIVNEPNEKQLALIISKTLNTYIKSSSIKLGQITNEKLTEILINLTKLENRILSNCSNKPINYDMYNPGLVIEIIDAMFADAIINNNSELTIENILYGINFSNRIKEDIKINIEKELKTLIKVRSIKKL